MRFGSVCSGIESASVAWEPLGWEAAWLSEIEAFPSAVLTHHWPDVPNLGDMTLLPARVAAGEIEAPDVLVGGTPCQAFSVAGHRESLADARGNLTLTYVELADAIDDKRNEQGEQPAIIVWENVPGVLNTKDNAFGCFLAGLAGEDVPLQPPGKRWTNAGLVLGPKRAVAWRILDAQYFGVAQRRRRVFVVASARDGFDPSQILLEFDGVRRDSAPRREARQDAPAGAGEGAVTASAEVSPTLLAKGNSSHRADAEAYVTTRQEPYHDVALYLNAGGMGRIDYESESMIVSTRDAGCISRERARYCVYDTTNITSPHNGSNPKPNDPVFTLARGQHPPLLRPAVPQTVSLQAGKQHAVAAANAFAQNTRDEVRLMGGDGEIAGALAAQPGMKQTTYVAPQSVALRGREGGATAELGGEVATALRASAGGGDKPHVLAEVSETLHTKGISHGVSYACTQKTYAVTLLQALRDEVGEEAFAQWGLGILDSLQPTPVLQSLLHGSRLRYAPLSRNWTVYCALARPEDHAEGAVRSVRDAERAGRASQGLQLSEQLAKELGAYLSFLSQPGTSASQFLHDLRGASEGLGLLQQALHTFQEMGRSARSEGEPAYPTIAVRRLMVMECEFLQGFPRNFTLVPHRGKPAADGPRYKAIGNSMAVPVMAWIGRRIADYIA